MAPALITARDLAELVGSARAPSLLDVRWEVSHGADEGSYREGHVPGAVFIDLDGDLADPPSASGRHPLPSQERFGEAMRRAGVSGSRAVVVYDAASGMAAARAWWLLRYFGHPSVTLLDGGLAAWAAAGHRLETGVARAVAGDFSARPGGMPVIDADEAARIATAGALIDARARERFLGLREPIDPVAGHIPGARSRPTADNLDAAGRFFDAFTLRRAFEDLGVREDTPVAAYCGSGVTATHEVLALELAGYRAALYPGSWSEWISDPGRAVELGGQAVG